MKRRSLFVILSILLLSAGLACSLTDTLDARLATQTADPPTPTATPTATPVPTLVPPAAQVVTVDAVAALQERNIQVYDAVAPSVVNITNRGVAYDFFMRAVPQEGSGSGFVYDDQGHIVTNYHVIEGAKELLVTMAGGQVYDAELIGSDPTNDLAVILIDAGDDLPAPLPLASSDEVRVGQFVIAIGNPFGLEQTLTTGVVSAKGRVIESPEDNRFIGEAIQTDAAINPGNSGGPLLDLDGRVIGVNSQIVSASGSSSGIGFAVSANTVQRVVPALIENGRYPHPWLGATMLSLTPNTAAIFREAGMEIPQDEGLLLIEIVDGSAADKANLRGGQEVVRYGNYRLAVGGDIVTAINGIEITNFEDLTVYLETETQVGDDVTVTIIRDGASMDVPLTLGEQPVQP